MASLAGGCAFFALWFWLLPTWLGFRANAAVTAPWRWIGLIPAAFGFWVSTLCVWNFGWWGRGTPIPVLPPTRLVVKGFYRYVRNPMAIGFLLGWAGLWVTFGRANAGAAIVAVIALAIAHLFVVLYEEPHLRRQFGAEYEEYCAHVRRWIPRIHAWNPSS